MRTGLITVAICASAPGALAANLEVTSLADSGPGSLRAVLATALGNAEADVITFSSSGTITLQTSLGPLGDAGCSGAVPCVSIDGGGAITLDGSSIPRPDPQGFGFVITGSGYAVQNLTISGFERGGVLLDGAGAVANVITGCRIGTDASGTVASATTVVGDAGVLIRSSANSNEISSNLISGVAPGAETHAAGVRVTGIGSDANRILGNTIGLTADGSAPIGGSGANMHYGVWVDDGATSTFIGEPGASNVIANQEIAGVLAEGTGTTDVVVVNNLIGTDATGTVEIGNGDGAPDDGGGVVFRTGVQASRIGEFGAGNVIAGNRNCQVRLDGAGPTNDVIANIIGAAGTPPTQRLSSSLGNVNGVCLENGAFENGVGAGLMVSETNRIGFHDPSSGSCPPACGAAVLLTGTGTSMNRIGGNTIGFVVTGETVLPGSAANHYGILIMDGAGPNEIGMDPNQITGTSRAAVAVVGSTTRGNALLHNWTRDNGTGQSPGVEICLARDLNDCRAHGYVADAARGNGGILPPRFDADAFFRSEPDMALLTGTASGPGQVYVYRVPSPVSDSGFGGAAETVGEAPVTGPPWVFEVPFPISAGTIACATAVFTSTGTHPNGSEFAANVRVVGDARGTDDDGSALHCRPVVEGEPTEIDDRCSAGFELVDGVCTRDLGCTATGAPPGLALSVVVIWRRWRRRT